MAKFLNCRINDKVWFSRKTYFYPDLPKSFQITQYDSPVGTDGEFFVNDRRVGIWRVHIEEDPGRIRRVGRSGEEVSLIDYNRSGVPLVEIVTAPDMTSPAEARDFLTDLMIELRHLVGITGDGEQTIRCDANISVGDERVEIKNITGTKNVEKGLKFEFNRQSKLLAAGKKIVRETRRFDEERGVTMPSREKEVEEDYGYIGEPDLGTYDVISLTGDLPVPETPLVRALRLSESYGLNPTASRQLVLTSWELADIFESIAGESGIEAASTWTLGPITANWKDLQKKLDDVLITEIKRIVLAVKRGEMNDNEGKMRISSLASGSAMEEPSGGPTEGLEDMIRTMVDEHPEIINDYKKNERAANFLVGLVLKETKGRYSSKEIIEKIKKELEGRG